MKQEHEIVARVAAAAQDTHAADELVRQYLPFIRSETAKFLRRVPREGQDDELSIAMLAFHEAVVAYRAERGAFLKFAALHIRSRLVDYARRESRHKGAASLDEPDEDNGRTMLEKLDTGHDPIAGRQLRQATREESLEFAGQLEGFGLKRTDVADNCPRQQRTLEACGRALAFARTRPDILAQVEKNGRVPLAQLAEGAQVERKTLERHRKYLVAILLAYTNGFEIIRGHLGQMSLMRGGERQ